MAQQKHIIYLVHRFERVLIQAIWAAEKSGDTLNAQYFSDTLATYRNTFYRQLEAAAVLYGSNKDRYGI